MVNVTTTLMEYLKRYRPGMTREEAAIAAGISLATFARRLREGLDADEVIAMARYVGASPVEALLELSLIEHSDVRAVSAATHLETLSDRVLLEELLARAVGRESADEADREEAGLPPSPPARFDVVHPVHDIDASALAATDDDAVVELPRAARHGDHDD